jgi:hypothetical protein
MKRPRRWVRVILASVVLTLAISAASLGQQALKITQVSLTSPIRHGRVASIEIRTAPNALCTIAVIYKSGASRAKGLSPKQAGSQGSVAWSWIVGTRTTPGTWPIIVNCSLGNRQGKLETSFDVT